MLIRFLLVLPLKVVSLPTKMNYDVDVTRLRRRTSCEIDADVVDVGTTFVVSYRRNNVNVIYFDPWEYQQHTHNLFHVSYGIHFEILKHCGRV